MKGSSIENGSAISEINRGRICPYCGQAPDYYTKSDHIYGRDYGPVYYCEPCQAWVGTHKGSRKALGRLANAELRRWKKHAHFFFDPIWKNTKTTRSQAYGWLAVEMGLSKKETHIGMFDVEQCKRVVKICNRAVNKMIK